MQMSKSLLQFFFLLIETSLFIPSWQKTKTNLFVTMNTQRDKSTDSNAVQIKTRQKGEIRGKNQSFDSYKANTMLILAI